MAIIKVGDKATAPSIRPSLNLDFANSKVLDPRINFTRSSTATYYDGFTRVIGDQNLFKDSQGFSSSYWDYSRHTLTGGQTAPDGTSTAYKFTQQSTDPTSGFFGHLDWSFKPGTYTFSGFFKAGADGGYVTLDERQGDQKRSYFNLTTGTVDSEHASHTATIHSAGSGWYRCSITFTVTSSATTQLLFYFSNSNTGNNTTLITNGGESGFAWGLQYEERDGVTSYVPTGAQPVETYQPVLKTAASHTARINHDPRTSECRGLQIEGAQTNITLYSQEAQPQPIGWQYNAYTYINNYGIAPDGTRTAIFAYPILGVRRHEISKKTEVVVNTPYTISFYAKKVSDLRYLNVSPTSGGDTALFTVDLLDGTITYKGTQGYGADAKIEDVGNGWYRVSSVFYSPTGTTVAAYMSAGTYETNNSVYGDTPGLDTTFHGILLWGFQVEAGKFSTSYIPTTTATASRSADFARIPYAEWAKVYNRTESTAIVEADASRVSDNVQNTVIYYGTVQSPSMHTYGGRFGGGVTSVFGLYPSASNHIQNGVPFKAGIGYALGSHITTVDGLYVNTSGNEVSLNHLNSDVLLGSGTSVNHINGHISKFTYYPERLSDDEIISLTEE